MSALNVMVIRVKRHANISKEATLLDGLDVSPLKYLRKTQVKIAPIYITFYGCVVLASPGVRL